MAKRWAWTLLTGLALSGCAGSDEVLFVTNTNIGLNLDSKPPAMSIAYDRADGYIGPVYGNGALAPVTARLQSDLDVFNPIIRQVYATGDAATILTGPGGGGSPPAERKLLRKAKRAAYFMTSSTLGLKVTFAENVPDSINLGYKRKEMSFIPIGTTKHGDCHSDSGTIEDEVDCYGSALATIDIGGNIADTHNTGIKLNQFFATGRAAENLAGAPTVRNLMLEELYKRSVVAAGYEHDDNSVKIENWLESHPVEGAFRQKCLDPKGLKYPPELNDPRYHDLRQECVTALGL